MLLIVSAKNKYSNILITLIIKLSLNMNIKFSSWRIIFLTDIWIYSNYFVTLLSLLLFFLFCNYSDINQTQNLFYSAFFIHFGVFKNLLFPSTYIKIFSKGINTISFRELCVTWREFFSRHPRRIISVPRFDQDVCATSFVMRQ